MMIENPFCRSKMLQEDVEKGDYKDVDEKRAVNQKIQFDFRL